MSLRFEVARPEDDAGIRALLRETDMAGDIRIAFTQEPRYYEGLPVQGERVDSLVARNGALVGLGCRAERRVFVNGEAARVGYLSGLRIRPEQRGATVLARGYRALKRLHEAGTSPYYLSTIVEDNHEAIALLASGRAGLPTYRDLGRFVTLVYSMRRPGTRKLKTLLKTGHAGERLPELLAFLRSEGPGRQYFPDYESGDLKHGLLQGLRPEDILLCDAGQGVTGCLGIWDQRAYRQRVVTGYSRRLAMLRPAANLLACSLGRPGLPAPGTPLGLACLALPVAQNPETFGLLLERALRACDERPGIELAVLGLHENDPLYPVAAAVPHRAYPSRLYQVFWEDGREAADAADARVPYLETGGL